MATPKLLNLSAPTIRNQRTLVWLQKQDTTVAWSKWDGIISDLDDFAYWYKHKANIVGAIISQPKAGDKFLGALRILSKNVPLVLVSQAVLSLKDEEYWTTNFDNIVNLDNILNQYPFIGFGWDGTVDDAVAIFALLMRYNRIVDAKIPEARHPLLTKYGVGMDMGARPNETLVFTQFFRHKNAERFNEIKECLKQNCSCVEIDKIVLLNEKDYSREFKGLEGSQKIQQIITGRRLTYADFLRYVADNVPQNVYVVLCNADIYFDGGLGELHKINLADKMLGLLRWDVPPLAEGGEAKIFGPRADSQDTWIFLSNSIKERTWNYSKFDFQLGQAGCDNAFAGAILRQKFLLSNPALSFKTYHLHNTNIRNYDKKDYIRSDIYINLAPVYIIDSRQEICPKGAPDTISNELVSFDVKSSSMSNEITYCTMLEKEGRYKWEPSVENHHFDAAMPIYKWTDGAAVSPSGLVYDLYNIYVGKTANDERYDYWAGANVDILTPMQKRSRMFAIPFKGLDIFKHPDVYILNYISRCARLLTQYPGTSFWVPPSFSEFLEYFDWTGRKVGKGAFFDENTAVWADEVIGLLPGPSGAELGAEDISTLRETLPSWIEKPCGKLCSIVLGQQITQQFAEEKIAGLLSDDWTIRYIRESDYASYDGLLGATLCIFIGGQKTEPSWAKLWALPKECCVIEFQQELQIDGEFQHLAHVAGFKSWVLLLAKGSVEDVQEQIMEQLGRWFKKNEEELSA